MTVVAGGRFGGGDVALWAGAGALALAAHAALAAWMLRQPPILPSDPAPPAAVMLELAPMPVAPEATETELAPDVVDQEQVLEAPKETLLPPDPVLEEMPPPDMPPPEIAAPLEDVLPPIDMTPVEVAEVAVTRPLKRPEDLPRPPEPEVPKEVARTPPPEKEPPREATKQARAEAPPAPKAAATQDSRGGASSISPATWKSRLMARLERAKRYPPGARKRGEEGVAYVSFAIDGQGRVLSAQLARSSGHAELDAEVLALVKRASPLPAPPPGVPGTITAPVKFNIR